MFFVFTCCKFLKSVTTFYTIYQSIFVLICPHRIFGDSAKNFGHRHKCKLLLLNFTPLKNKIFSEFRFLYNYLFLVHLMNFICINLFLKFLHFLNGNYINSWNVGNYLSTIILCLLFSFEFIF